MEGATRSHGLHFAEGEQVFELVEVLAVRRVPGHRPGDRHLRAVFCPPERRISLRQVRRISSWCGFSQRARPPSAGRLVLLSQGVPKRIALCNAVFGLQQSRRNRLTSATAFRESIERHARYSLAQPWDSLSPRQVFECVSLAVRDLLIDRHLDTERRFRHADAKSLSYVSIEYLLGRLLTNNLINLGIYDLCRDTLRQMGVSLEALEEPERDPALGNGGLGRLAACFLDSLATLDMPAYGYGINYEYGLFRQEIDNGYQKEKPDNWLTFGTPWEIERPDEACLVPVYGRIEHGVDRSGRYNPMWLDWRLLIGVPHDVFVAGYGGRTVNVLRLFSARSSRDFDMEIFNTGDYLRAVEQTDRVGNHLEAAVPLRCGPARAGATPAAGVLPGRLRASRCGRPLPAGSRVFDAFAAKVAIQLNDTHPALAIAELMRTLVDERDMPWDPRGRSPRRRWATRITRCCQRHSRSGPWPCSNACCRGTCKSSTRSIVASWRTSLGLARDIGRLQRMSLIEEGEANRCGWRT